MAKKKVSTVTNTQAVILQLLMSGDEKYGLQMIAESNGHLKRGTVYVLLNRLEDDGLIKSKKREQVKGEQGPARRVYQITGKGKRALEAKLADMKSMMGLFGMEG